MDWGWNPDTVIAVATSMAMLAAITAGIFAGMSFTQMKKQAESVAEQLLRDRVDRERAQAESIAAWTEKQGDEIVLIVQNASLVPIYDVRAAACLGSENSQKYFYAARKTMLSPSKDRGHPIEPAEATRAHYPDWARKRSKNLLPRVDLIFNDKNGVAWHRTHDGCLV